LYPLSFHKCLCGVLPFRPWRYQTQEGNNSYRLDMKNKYVLLKRDIIIMQGSMSEFKITSVFLLYQKKFSLCSLLCSLCHKLFVGLVIHWILLNLLYYYTNWSVFVQGLWHWRKFAILSFSLDLIFVFQVTMLCHNFAQTTVSHKEIDITTDDVNMF
jgi:uncharacterized membrane protein YciS (DUF1049 family)